MDFTENAGCREYSLQAIFEGKPWGRPYKWIYQWLSVREQYLKYVSKGDTAVLL